MSYFSHSGANVPGSESSRERKYQGAKVPPVVLSLHTFALGSESMWERKFQFPAKVPSRRQRCADITFQYSYPYLLTNFSIICQITVDIQYLKDVFGLINRPN